MNKELAKKEKQSIEVLLDAMTPQFKKVLPATMSAERMTRIALTEFRANPGLQTADPMSFLKCLMLSAQIGLEPSTVMGHVYLIPYNREIQLIIGYKGMLELIYRTGRVSYVEAHAVYENDEFDYEAGMTPRIIHKPAQRLEGASTIAFYAIAHLKEGPPAYAVMWEDEVRKIQKAAKSQKVWGPYYEEMGKKTVIRRLFKYIPLSPEIALAVANDERADAGVPQELGAGIEIDPMKELTTARIQNMKNDFPNEDYTEGVTLDINFEEGK